MPKNVVLAVVVAIALAASACTRTFTAVNPRPSAVVDAETGKLALDASAVPDTQQPHSAVTVKEFQRTLQAGFRNMVGSNFTPDARQAALRLRLEQAELGTSNLGSLGAFFIIRYRATWYGPDGAKIASLAGVAQPRNPTETGPRHLEDVVEVMYEETVHGLEKAQGVKTR
jgi:hypothetical protein